MLGFEAVCLGSQCQKKAILVRQLSKKKHHPPSLTHTHSLGRGNYMAGMEPSNLF